MTGEVIGKRMLKWHLNKINDTFLILVLETLQKLISV